MEEVQKLLKNMAIQEAVELSVGLSKVQNRTQHEIFVDVLKEKGYVVISIKELEELKDKAWRYDELEY